MTGHALNPAQLVSLSRQWPWIGKGWITSQPKHVYIVVDTPSLRLPKKSALLIFNRVEDQALDFSEGRLVHERPLPKQLRSMISAARKKWDS